MEKGTRLGAGLLVLTPVRRPVPPIQPASHQDCGRPVGRPHYRLRPGAAGILSSPCRSNNGASVRLPGVSGRRLGSFSSGHPAPQARSGGCEIDHNTGAEERAGPYARALWFLRCAIAFSLSPLPPIAAYRRQAAPVRRPVKGGCSRAGNLAEATLVHGNRSGSGYTILWRSLAAPIPARTRRNDMAPGNLRPHILRMTSA